MNYDKIEREVEHMDERGCSFCNYDSSDIAQSLRLLLAYVNAIETYGADSGAHWQARAALKEHCDE